MFKALILTVGIVLIATVQPTNGQMPELPSFDRYPAKVWKGKSKPPNLRSHKDARLFRTSLRDAAKDGINFAGHFVLTTWGCGSSCTVGAIIDGKTGEVFFPKQLEGFWWQFWDGDERKPFGFQKDSRLLMFLGFEPGDYNSQRRRYGFHIYRWTGRALNKIKYIRQPFGNETKIRREAVQIASEAHKVRHEVVTIAHEGYKNSKRSGESRSRRMKSLTRSTKSSMRSTESPALFEKSAGLSGDSLSLAELSRSRRSKTQL